MAAKGKKDRAPGEGERAARRGYVHQDRSSARLIYAALLDRSLRWIGLADRKAGVADDLVLGLTDTIVAHQFKRSEQPSAVGVTALLLGKEKEIARLAASYEVLRMQFPEVPIRLRFLSNDYPAAGDTLLKRQAGSSTAAFMAEWALHPQRTIAEWRATSWGPLLDLLIKASGLTEERFDRFWRNFDLILGPNAAPTLEPGEDEGRRDQVETLARTLATLVADNPRQDRWSREEFLEAVGWPDRFALRFAHSFPVGRYVQRNEATEARLVGALRATNRGYLSLVGPPGAGKSTLLQRELRDQPGVRVIRYLAFVPGTAQGQGRGEADSFYDDVNAQLGASGGLRPHRLKDDTTWARQQAFEDLLAQAGQKFAKDGARHVIVVDGLDHVPREEHPSRSLLAALPLPQAVPEGVILVLGTQRLDLPDIPAAVRDEAGADARRIDIDPLSKRAVAAIADSLGLPPQISRRDVFRITRGHPLVTRYLVERLIAAPPPLRDELLAGEHGFGGDLEAVYEAAWRGIEQEPHSELVKRVLALIAHADGAIEPETLAKATSDEAVESALAAVGHLLLRSDRGWAVFHNSFGLFVRGKPVLRFGAPDPQFAPAALYRTLAALAAEATHRSAQRWLTFRYLYLAGDYDEALTLAGRAYFVGQYCGGRPPAAVRGDISDALRALKGRSDPAKLFDLMLAEDEVSRRTAVMEGATSLIEAYIAAGDLEAARAALSEPFEEGKQWLVVDALIKASRVEAAREILARQNPFELLRQNAPPYSRSGAREVLPWAQRAILFMDEDQLERYLDEGSRANSESGAVNREAEDERADLILSVKFQIARAVVGGNSGLEVLAVAGRWAVGADLLPILLLEKATSAFDRGDDDEALRLLDQALAHPALRALHVSWPVLGARLSERLGWDEGAKRFLDLVPVSGLAEIEDQFRSERLVPACRHLLSVVALRRALRLDLPPIGLPKERLLRGVQHHLVALASAIGAARTDKPVGQGAVDQLCSAALHFLATARVTSEDDWFSGYLIRRAAELVGEAIFALVGQAPSSVAKVAQRVDDLIERETPLFRWWPDFRRLVALSAFSVDGDAPAAERRLEQGLADISASDPREEVEERAAYAAAFARVGAIDRAREVLSQLRQDALGVYLPAKKDGQYELWVGLLDRANEADPQRRADRAATALQLLEGLERTEGSGMARRIARQVLFEASAANPKLAWSAARWAAGTGTVSWDGIVDSTLRGILKRQPHLATVLLIAWSRLCLPWYGEPHGSTTRTGSFLRNLMELAPHHEVDRLERAATSAIAALAAPQEKVVLFTALEEAARSRGSGDVAGAARLGWYDDPGRGEKEDVDQRSYGHLVSLAEVADAIAAEKADRPASDRSGYTTGVRAAGVSYSLEHAASRVIKTSAWTNVRAFLDAHSVLTHSATIVLAAAEAAVAAGNMDAARAILPKVAFEDEGWSWPSERGRMRYHRARHLLREPDAFDAARDQFIGDMAAARYGIGTTLWDTEAIFPLLFEQVPWPELWDKLAEQLRSMREYRTADPPPLLPDIDTDEALLAAVFAWALSLGVPLLHAEATRGALQLLDCARHDIFAEAATRLLDGGGEGTMLGMDLLARASDDPRLAPIFGSRVVALVNDPDGGVAAAACFLASRWGLEAELEVRSLPPLYDLHLPPPTGPKAQPAASSDTRGMVIEDPLGWTVGWERTVRLIEKYGGVSATHVRSRVRRLIQDWGGIETFGHRGSIRLQEDLDRLGLKMSYRRPQAAVTVRALRHVVGELRQAGRLTASEWRSLLHDLHADPDRPTLPTPEARDLDATPRPAVPRMMWGKEQEEWLDRVAEDLPGDCQNANRRVLAEWRRFSVRKTRITSIAEQWHGAAGQSFANSDLVTCMGDLPRVISFGRIVPLYDRGEVHPSRTAVFLPHEPQGEPSRLLIFCPLTAASLGWSTRGREVHVYYDADGQEMARTIWWRDGLPQPVDQDEYAAEGQRVVFSGAGLSQFEGNFGRPALTTLAWRRVEAAKDDGAPGSRFATDSIVPSLAR